MANHTPGPWKWYNGCSWWRLGLANEQSKHDAVLCPTIDRDGHPNLRVSEADRRLIESAPELQARIAALEQALEGLQLASDLREAMTNPKRLDAARETARKVLEAK